MSTANDAIEILQGALILADFLEKEECEQILRRIQQHIVDMKTLEHSSHLLVK